MRVSRKIPPFLFSFLCLSWCPFLYSVVWLFMDTPSSIQMVSSHSFLHHSKSYSLWSEGTWGAWFSFFFFKDWAFKSHGRYISRPFGGCSVPCESAKVGGRQGEWGVTAGFVLHLAHTWEEGWPCEGHTRPFVRHSEKACRAPFYPGCGNGISNLLVLMSPSYGSMERRMWFLFQNKSRTWWNSVGSDDSGNSNKILLHAWPLLCQW